MTDPITARVREALGAEAVGQDTNGRPRVAPESSEDLARVMGLAHAEGWKVRIEGRATWCAVDVPADLVISTSALDCVVNVAPQDLVTTVEAGATFGTIQHRLAEDRVWLACDPPGRAQRSIGSVLATGTAGPLRHRFGPVRDLLLGVTFVTGDGRVIRPGGTVVKNVAGYDLGKLVAGSFGAFGIITELHLRLRAIPEVDRTLLARGSRDSLTLAGRDLSAAAIDAVALELFSPAMGADPEWVLAVRLMGEIEGVEAEAARTAATAALPWTTLAPEQANALWHGASHAAHAGSVTLRLGVLVDGLDDTLDLLADHLDIGLVSAGAGSGSIRWTGEATVERLMTFRRAAAGREIPVTLERGPWSVRQGFGHFGLYREGVSALVGRLRDSFDPGHVLLVPLDAAP
ncbi:MAG TPA: FAD-binding oxidoreductase [Gemmatimonadales bacterium]|nr:FAD-binding oxidoreductase [Gemmatimonadales bacterium]